MFRQFVAVFLLVEILTLNVCLAASEKISSNTKGENSGSFWDSISFPVSYSVQSDFADEAKPRVYSHLIRASLKYELDENYLLGLSSSFYYKSLNEEILLKDGTYGFSDLRASLSRSFPLGQFLSATNSINFQLSGDFPLSEEARLEGYKAVPSLSASIQSKFFDKKYVLRNSFSYHYVVNTYEYSPASAIANNRDSLSYSMSHSIQLIKKLVFALGFGFRYSRNTQGESNYSYNNSQSIRYSFSKLSLGIQYYNGGFTGDGDVDLWYIDRYRKNLKASLGYSF